MFMGGLSCIVRGLPNMTLRNYDKSWLDIGPTGRRVIVHLGETHENFRPFIEAKNVTPYKLVAWVPKSKAQKDSIHVFFAQQINLEKTVKQQESFQKVCSE